METGIVGSVLPSVLRRRKNEDGIVPDKSMQEDCATAEKTAQTIHGRSRNANSEPSEADETTKCSGNDTDDTTMNGSQNQGEGDEAIDEKVNRIVQKILETSSTDKSKKPKQANGVRKADRPSQGAPRKRPPKAADADKSKAGNAGSKANKSAADKPAQNGCLDGEPAKQEGNPKKDKSGAPKKKKAEGNGPGTGTGSGTPRSKSRKRTKAANQKSKNVPLALFPRTAMLTRNWSSTNRFEVGMCLESIDPQRPAAFCPFVVVDKKTFRIRLHFIDYGCEYFDFWIPFYSPLLFPVGFCERTGRTLRSRTAPTAADERTTTGGTPAAFSWRAYFDKHAEHRAAPPTCFATLGRSDQADSAAAPPEDTRFRVGMKLEALDKRNPNMYGVATVRDVLELELNEFVATSPITNVASTLDHATQPNGTPHAESSTTETRTEALPSATQDRPEPTAHDSVENATVNGELNGESTAPESYKSNGSPCGSGRGRPLTYLLVHFDGWPEEYEHWCDAASASVRWCSFCAERGELLCLPSEWPQHVTFDWPQYLAHTHAVAAPRRAFHSAADAEMDIVGVDNTQPIHFETGMRLCAVDRRNPQVVRYATVRAVESHKLLLRFEDFDEPPTTTVCRVHPRDDVDIDADADVDPAECVCVSEEEEAEREERAARFDFWLDEDSLDMLPVEFAQRIGAYIMKPMSAEERATQRRLAQLKSGDTSAFPADNETSTAEPDEERAKQRKPWVYRCLTPGCRGRGHLNGYTVKHVTEAGCPYAPLNASKTLPLYDRYEFDRALEKHATDNGQTVEQMAGTSAISEFIERYFARAAAEEPPPPPPSGFVPLTFRQLSQSSDRSAAGRNAATAKGNAKSAQKSSSNSRVSASVKGATPCAGKPAPTTTPATPAATPVPAAVNGRAPAKKIDEQNKTALSRKRAQGDSDSEASRSVSRSRSASPGAPPPAGDAGQFKTPLPPKRNRLSADAKPPETNDSLRATPVDAATLRNLTRDEAGVGTLLNAVGVDTSLLAVGARARSSETEPEASRWLTPVSAEMWRQQVIKLTAVDLRELRSHLDTSVLLWNREQLVIFVVQVTNQRDAASAIRRAFEEHSIDPASFLLLHFSDLTRSMHLRVGVALKIFACVQYLRGEISQLPGDTPAAR